MKDPTKLKLKPATHLDLFLDQCPFSHCFFDLLTRWDKIILSTTRIHLKYKHAQLFMQQS